jgi:hypothetical protein
VNGASGKTGDLIFIHGEVRNQHLAVSNQHSALKHFAHQETAFAAAQGNSPLIRFSGSGVAEC